jgi:aryl-alcohol dehydrogenase-like predicted oxidoreductase
MSSPLASAGRLGLGAGALGDPALPETDADRLLDLALDLGLRLVDTAPSYGLSERRVGRLARRRRREVLVSTKLGYGVPGIADWTAPCIEAGVERALDLLGVEALDVAHLHSCPLEVLVRGEVVEALLAAVAAGKVRFAAYSGEGEPLSHAISCGAFQVVQASCSLVDPAAAELRAAKARGLGTIAKRPLGNAPWRDPTRPQAPDRALYFDRWSALALPDLGLPPEELMLRWSAWHPHVDVAIVGTSSPVRLRAHAEAVARGPLPQDIVSALEGAVERAGGWAWKGVI